jgi:hypothetical protein
VQMLPSVEEVLAKASFGKVGEPDPAAEHGAGRILVAVDEATRAELDKRGIKYFYTVLPMEGVNTGNFKPLNVALISNAPSANPSPPATGPTAAELLPDTMPGWQRPPEGAGGMRGR